MEWVVAFASVEAAIICASIVALRRHDAFSAHVRLMYAVAIPLIVLGSQGSPLYGMLPSQLERIVEGVCLLLFLLTAAHFVVEMRRRR